MWTEQNVLKIDMEGVVCDVEQCAVEKVMDVIYKACPSESGTDKFMQRFI
jgi:hypothetical protein